jgi:hypothetical protein
MATINIAASNNRVNRMQMSKSVTLLRYSDRDASTGGFNGVASLLARITGLGRTASFTNPFTVG